MMSLLIILILIGTITSALGSYFLKKGAGEFNFNLLFQIKNLNLIFGFGLYFFGTILYLFVLSKEKLSLVYPLTSLTYVWIFLISKFVLKEKINFISLLGLLFIFVGIFFIVGFT